MIELQYVKIKKKLVRDLSPAEYLKLSRFNFRWDGKMQLFYQTSRKRKNDTDFVVLIYYFGRLIGHSLSFRRIDDDYIQKHPDCPMQNHYYVHFWIHNRYRGQGFGRMLMKKTIRRHPKTNHLIFEEYDNRSYHFFTNTVLKHKKRALQII